ncbi:MAG: PRC-barrel domain-containing protein [Chloroflexi bacterium]|nr:PRC-barrel domain-containing protein [Chloroflexota bacterium]
MSVNSAEKLGFVDSLYLDLANHRVLGLRLRRGGLLTHHSALLFSDVKSIGKDALIIDDPGRINDEGRFTTLEGAAGLDAIAGARVLSEGGREVGTVSDLDFDPDTGKISGYVLAAGFLDRLRHDERVLPASDVKSAGNKLLMVGDDAVPAS